MNVEILQEAEDELNAAVAYYEDIETGLGIRLKEEARAAIHWVGRNPEVPRLREKGYRRVNLKVLRWTQGQGGGSSAGEIIGRPQFERHHRGSARRLEKN